MLGHVLMNRKLSLVHHITKLLCTVLRHKRASSKFYTTASQALLPGTHVLQLNLEPKKHYVFPKSKQAKKCVHLAFDHTGLFKILCKLVEKKGLVCILKDSLRILWGFFEGSLRVLWWFIEDSLRILWGFFEDSLRIHEGFLKDSWRILGGFLKDSRRILERFVEDSSN